MSSYQTEVATKPELPDVETVRIRGTVRFDSAPDFRKTLLDEVSRTQAQRLVFELAGVEEMDTSGAAVLVEALAAARERGLRVLFCSPSDSVMQLFRLAGFEDMLERCCPNPRETWRRLQEC